jgi:hypothetical protein
VDPRGFPTTLPEFQRVFPDDRACATYLERRSADDSFAQFVTVCYSFVRAT